MSRIEIPSAVPADRAEVLSDIGDDLTPQQEDQIERDAEELLAERMESAEWMVPVFEEELRIGNDVHTALLALDDAINGDKAKQETVFRALANIQKQAKLACTGFWMEQLKEQAEADLFGGA